MAFVTKAASRQASVTVQAKKAGTATVKKAGGSTRKGGAGYR